MKNAILLDRAHLKKVQGGVQKNVCEGKTGIILKGCLYNACMSGWDFTKYEDNVNNDKIDTCMVISGMGNS